MSDPDPSGHRPDAATPRPPADSSPALLIGASEGVAPVAVTGEYEVAALVRDPLGATIRRVALPTVASTMLMTLFATVDALWVGRYLGPQALAAVSTSLFWIWFIIAVAEMVSVGLSAVAARRHGEGRPGEAARVATDALVWALLLGSAIALLAPVLIDPMLAVMRTPPEVTALARAYLGTYLIGAPLLFGFFAVDAIFRARGDMRTPFMLLGGSVVVTLLLDPVLILGLGPVPRLGIVGAAIATVSIRAVVCVIGVLILVRRRMLVIARPRPATWLAVSRVGLPIAITGITFSLIYVAVTRTTTTFGTPALAAIGIGHRVESWIYMVSVGFGAASAAIVAQNLGAGRVDRARRTGWLTMSYATIPGIVLAIVCFAIAEDLAGLFTGDPATVAEGARYLRISAISNFVIAAEIVLEASMGGAGYTLAPMLTSTLLTASRVPFAAWAAAHWGPPGIWWTITITAAARGLAMVVLWRNGRWARTSI
jgi:putative MATE family efflux protein